MYKRNAICEISHATCAYIKIANRMRDKSSDNINTFIILGISTYTLSYIFKLGTRGQGLEKSILCGPWYVCVCVYVSVCSPRGNK